MRFEVQIMNWEKYNPDTKKRAIWFRASMDEFSDHVIANLSGNEFKFWHWLRCERTRVGHQWYTVHTSVVRRTILVRTSVIHSTIAALTSHNIVQTKGYLCPKGFKDFSSKNDVLQTDRQTLQTDRDIPKKTKSVARPKAPALPGDLSLGQEWLDLAHEVMGWRKDTPGFTVEKFADGIAKVKAKTDLNDDGIRAVLKFIAKDDFWRDKAVSPVGLLKVGGSGVRKIDTILSQMKPKEDGLKRALAEFAAGPVPEEFPF